MALHGKFMYTLACRRRSRSSPCSLGKDASTILMPMLKLMNNFNLGLSPVDCIEDSNLGSPRSHEDFDGRL